LELNEQELGSDEDNVIGVLQNPDRIEDWVQNTTTSEEHSLLVNEREQAAKRTAEKIAAEKAEKEAIAREAERKQLQRELKDNEEKALAVRTKLEQEEADANRVILHVKEKLEKLSKPEKVSIPEAASPEVTSGNSDERLVQIFAQAINKANLGHASIPSDITNKFLARQGSKDLPGFCGKPEEWSIFKAEFDRTTADGEYKNSDNITRLRKALRGDAAKYVQSLLVTADSVPVIMRKLEVRYGQPELIIEAMIQKAKVILRFNYGQMDIFI